VRLAGRRSGPSPPRLSGVAQPTGGVLKIAIHAAAEGITIVAELWVSHCSWDPERRQLSMVRGIGDGYYAYPITGEADLRDVASGPEGLEIHISSPAEVYRLAKLLRTEDDFCQDSFTRMQV
jgi:hypothetical protein